MKGTVTGQQQKNDYVLVPRIPTREMVDAAWAYALDEDAEGVWRSMLNEYEASHSASESLRLEVEDHSPVAQKLNIVP
jgi:hypothetical protein